jgi:hypothetical protein
VIVDPVKLFGSESGNLQEVKTGKRERNTKRLKTGSAGEAAALLLTEDDGRSKVSASPGCAANDKEFLQVQIV